MWASSNREGSISPGCGEGQSWGRSTPRLRAFRNAVPPFRDGLEAGRAESAILILTEGKQAGGKLPLNDVRQVADKALGDEQFAVAMSALARLRRPVDEFFDRVTVNCDETDLRENRLRLLSEIRATLNRVADFAKIEG